MEREKKGSNSKSASLGDTNERALSSLYLFSYSSIWIRPSCCCWGRLAGGWIATSPSSGFPVGFQAQSKNKKSMGSDLRSRWQYIIRPDTHVHLHHYYATDWNELSHSHFSLLAFLGAINSNIHAILSTQCKSRNRYLPFASPYF